MNGVNRRDRDGRDYSVSIRTNRWYLRIWFWVLDSVCHSAYIVVKFIAESGIRKDWLKYTKNKNGRKLFQVELGLHLMEYGIRHDWGDVRDAKKKPKWMRQTAPVPCACGTCFHCKEGFTNGIYHAEGKVKKRGTKRKQPHSDASMEGCSEDRESFGGGSAYCCSCYRKQRRLNPSESAYTSKRKSGKPLKGCLNCNERICAKCWPKYDHAPTEKMKCWPKYDHAPTEKMKCDV